MALSYTGRHICAAHVITAHAEAAVRPNLWRQQCGLVNEGQQ